MYTSRGREAANNEEVQHALKAQDAPVSPVIQPVPDSEFPASYEMTLSADDKSISVRGPKAFLKAVANALVTTGVMTIPEEELRRLEE